MIRFLPAFLALLAVLLLPATSAQADPPVLPIVGETFEVLYGFDSVGAPIWRPVTADGTTNFYTGQPRGTIHLTAADEPKWDPWATVQKGLSMSFWLPPFAFDSYAGWTYTEASNQIGSWRWPTP